MRFEKTTSKLAGLGLSEKIGQGLLTKITLDPDNLSTLLENLREQCPDGHLGKSFKLNYKNVKDLLGGQAHKSNDLDREIKKHLLDADGKINLVELMKKFNVNDSRVINIIQYKPLDQS